MALSSIASYVFRAARFSGCCVLCIWLIRLLFRRTLPFRQEAVFLLKCAYLAALTEIIALRGLNVSGDQPDIQYIPFRTVFEHLQAGPWPFVYHTIGNLIWFVPLGFILGKHSIRQVFLAGLSLSFLLEAGQWLLKTGTTDIDDLWLNALGAGTGWWLRKWCIRIKRQGR